MKNWSLENILQHLQTQNQTELIQAGLHGIERETLRVNPDGTLATTPHPKSLSDPLTDPHITTDFSESQLELITAPHESVEEAIDALTDIHKQVLNGLENDEMIWPGSMPCILPDHDDIPVAKYGEGPEAATKETYRRGLALRYGKYIQMLCGVHYNLSFSEDLWTSLHKEYGQEQDLQSFKNERIMGLVRNFIRYRWLLAYLIGVTPHKHSSYQCKKMKRFCPKKAIALRLSQCGYHNPKEVKIDYNNFEDHLASVEKAMNTPHPPYTKLGLTKDGEPQQLNDHLLQIANEYYFPIRMKSKPHSGGFLEGLKENGVAYTEVRLLDVDPNAPTGMSADTLRLTHLFVLFCWLEDSPALTQDEYDQADQAQEFIAVHGQEPLPDEYKESGAIVLQKCSKIASLIDNSYQEVAQKFMENFHHPTDLSWKKMIDTMETNDQDFIAYNLAQSALHKKTLLNE